ncbi:MAG TPA: undecaprenyl-phosphate glucose phosphotransferase [Burkholderiales bacterium]|nr:undecaprenyl-phosphate glucose phosphotransferase [Burkholderiales bacterium]
MKSYAGEMGDLAADVRPLRFNMPLTRRVAGGMVACADILIGLTVSALAQFVDTGITQATQLSFWLAAIYALLVFATLHVAGKYKLERLSHPLRESMTIVPLCMAVSILMVLFVNGIGIVDRVSADWAVMFFAGTTAGMCAFRFAIAQLVVSLSQRGYVARSIAVVGSSAQAERLINTLREKDEPWLRIIGFFDDRATRSPGRLAGRPYCGTIEDLIDYARATQVDEVVVTLPWSNTERITQIIQRLKVLPANVRLAPEGIAGSLNGASLTNLKGVPLLTVYDRPISEWSWVLKSLEDRILGTLMLVLLSPVMLLCALAIKLDSRGPVFFKQPRYGYNNKLIEVWKFRSMYIDKTDLNAEALTTRDDPRVTRVGNILRRTSLDELPQLFNVVMGDMSVVGPRPHAVKAKAAGKLYQDVVTEYAVRHKIKPGITGWAQVNGWRGETDTEEKILKRVEHDIYYMENWSLWLDLKIIARTALVGLWGQNAY